MKRLTKQILAVTMILVLTGLISTAVYWVAGTTSGTRWLLTKLPPLAGIHFSAQTIEGTVGKHLLLTQVRLGLPQQKIEVDRLELRWKPSLLLASTVAVKELTINGVRIQDNSPIDTTPPVLAWPKTPQTARLLDGSISQLRITDIVYRRLQEPALLVKSFTGSVLWQNSQLSIKGIKLVSDAAQLSGTVSAGFAQPSLTADLAVALMQPVADMNRFSIQVRPVSGSPKPFMGTVTLGGARDMQKLLELSGDIGMTRNSLQLRRLHLVKPGQKGLITANGSLALTGKQSVLALDLKATGLDLAPQLNIPTDISGTLTFAGTLDRYQGSLSFSNQAKGWQAATVASAYHGTSQGVQFAPLKGSLLDGSLGGNLTIDWRKGFTMQGMINARNLNPTRISPDWQGVANINANGKLAWSGNTPVSGTFNALLLESRLHGQALTGELRADINANRLILNRLTLQGKGFDLQASGELDKHLSVQAQISDLSRLIPEAAGTAQAGGWLRWADGRLGGNLAGTASRFSYNGVQIASAKLSAQADQGMNNPMHLTTALRNLVYNGYKLDAVALTADGALTHHTIQATLQSSDSKVQLLLAAGYDRNLWKGELTRLAGRDKYGPWNLANPAAFSVSAANLSLSPVILTAGAQERLEVSVNLALNPLNGQMRANWSGLNLSRANPCLKEIKLTGSSHGTIRAAFLSDKRLDLSGTAGGNGRFNAKGVDITLKRGLISFDGSKRGLRIAAELEMADGGRLKGTFLSAVPFSLVVPEKGNLTAELSGTDLALLKPWLPRDALLEGHINGRATGTMLPGQRFELDGDAVLSGGVLQQKRSEGDQKISFRSATARWRWRGETLSGDLSLTMAEHGKVHGNFQLPLPGRFPVAINPKGALRVSIAGQVQEKGLLTALFPGFIQESSGTLATDLMVNGTWETPQIGGTLRLSRAAAYLPTAGIHLKEVQLSARLAKDQISITSFRADSGPGHIEGTALLILDGWQLKSYQGTIAGTNFQTIHFPELQMVSNPKLNFEGIPQKLTLRGELKLPELNIIGTQSPTVIKPSNDVIREGKVVPVTKHSSVALDVQIKLLLGEKVFVKASGIDARLGGAIELTMSSLDNVSSKGEIKVLKGRYRTYGVNLEIVRGRLFFAGGPATSPSLDFLALRSIGDIRAGVTVTGTVQKPVTKLYSEPAMPDIDILAYIVLGHPLGSNSEQAGLMTQAAGALLTSGQAAVLQEQLKNKLGLSTLEIHGGVGGTTDAMGYKPLQVTQPGTVATAQQPGITETVLTVGKYLTPQLYLSYGKSLFTGSNLIRLRYDIFKHWQIETQTGSDASGADIYYKLEFR